MWLSNKLKDWALNSDAARVNVRLGSLRELGKEITDLKDSQTRLVDALAACKERNGEV